MMTTTKIMTLPRRGGFNTLCFSLTAEQGARFQTWRKEHDKVCRLRESSGRWTFEFTPTGVGDVTIVRCGCGEKVNLTRYGDW